MSESNSYFQHHVFFCLNQREDGASCCAASGAEAAFNHMKSRVKALKLNGKDKVRVNRAGCLDRCDLGPLLVIYPGAIWYQFVDNEDIDEIIESHLINDQPVKRLIIEA